MLFDLVRMSSEVGNASVMHRTIFGQKKAGLEFLLTRLFYLRI